MTERDYRRQEGISRTELWRLRESPEKFKWYQEHPEPSTPTQIFGAAVHKLLLEPDSFGAEFAIAPECDRRTKDGREAYNAFLASSDGKSAITLADYEKAQEMANKALDAPFVKKLLAGEREKPFYWTDDLTGEPCKIRLDCLTYVNGKPIIVDYKTTADASTDGFIRSAINYGYDFQAGMYCEGVERVTGQKPLFVFIAQEKIAPYAVNILQADDLMVKRGYDIFRELIGIYHECKETGNWYGYLGAYNVINNLSLPAWLAKGKEKKMIKSYDAKIPDTTRKTKRKETEKDVGLFLTNGSSTAEIQVKGEKASAVYQRYRAYIIRNGFADRLQAIQRKNRVFLAKKEET